MLKSAQRAFTMIELLVVIAVIGVMATAVLSAINPLEQINKGKDTSLRSDAEQLLSSVDRYYSSLTYFPWQNGSNDNTAANVNVVWSNITDFITNRIILNGQDFLNNLESTQEIKHGFPLRLKDTKRTQLYISYNNTAIAPSMYACFIPASYAFLTEAYNRCKTISQIDNSPYSATSTACGGGVPSATADTCKTNKNCYICLP